MPLLTIDGSNAAHRAYYAIPPRSHNGMPIHVIFGFFSILLSNLKAVQPRCCAVTFDLPGTNFRNEVYPLYKSTRERKPEVSDSMRLQIPVIRDLCVAMGIAVVARRTIEADDIVGSLAVQYYGPSYVLSGDKDFAQLLVHKNIRLINPNKKITVSYKNCKEVYGIKPKRVVDYLMLEGDAVDAIPGVQGVGVKTAIKLIDLYGKAENIPAEAFPKHARENYKTVKKQLELNRKLVTIQTDLYDSTQLDTDLGKPDKAAIKALCKQYGLTGLSSLLIAARTKNHN